MARGTLAGELPLAPGSLPTIALCTEVGVAGIPFAGQDLGILKIEAVDPTRTDAWPTAAGKASRGTLPGRFP